MKAFSFVTGITVTALAFIASPLLHAEEALGRLFYTPEKRQLLDQQRALNTLELQQLGDSPELSVNGQVRRSSGKRTIWINNQSQHDGETPTGTVTQPAPQGHGRVIVVQEGGEKTEVKVGATLNKETRETYDPIGDGKIVIQKNQSKTKQ